MVVANSQPSQLGGGGREEGEDAGCIYRDILSLQSGLLYPNRELPSL